MKPSSVVKALIHCIKVHRPTMVWGGIGVGKSDVIALVASALGRQLVDVRLSLMDPTEVKGFPMPDLANDKMRWLAADFLPPMVIKKEIKKGKNVTTDLVPNDSTGIIFFDECNSALPATQATMYQFMLTRSIGSYVLPAGWDIVCAGNRESDRSVVHKMPAALSSRLLHIDLEVNFEEWISWAHQNSVPSEIISFLRFRSELLHKFDPKENPRSFPCPRSWHFASSILKSGMPVDIELELLQGTVGPGAAGELMAHMSIYRELPDMDAILADPERAPLPTKLSALYAVSVELAIRMTSTNIEKAMKYIYRMPAEFQVVTMRDAIRRPNSGLDKTRAYTSWCVANASVLT